MFKKFLAIVSLICLFVVQANAATGNGLKAAFDDLNYSLSVEWDQKDNDFYNKAQAKFANAVRDLQSKGLTNKELIDFAVSSVKDEKLAKDINTALSLVVINKMSQQEAHKYVTDMVSKSYDRGASWNGGAGAAIATVLVIVAVVAVALVITGDARVEDGCYQVYQCTDYCSAGVCYQDCGYDCAVE